MKEQIEKNSMRYGMTREIEGKLVDMNFNRNALKLEAEDMAEKFRNLIRNSKKRGGVYRITISWTAS